MMTGEATTPLNTGLAAINEALGDYPTSDQELTGAKCRALLEGYDQQYHDQDWGAVEVETEFAVAIYNPNAQTMSASRTFRSGGKIDVIAKQHKGSDLWLFDHKTTSNEIDNPDAMFWRQLAVDSQVDTYLWAEHLQGVDLTGAVWDVIRKPSIRPRQLKLADCKLITSAGTYFGRAVSESAKAFVLDDKIENAELYGLRLVADIAGRPGWYFQRRSVPRLREELFTYAQELWQLSQEIRETRANNRHYRNSGACMAYNTPCQFLGICSGYDTPDSDKWVRLENVHTELEHVDGESRNILTNSRLRCFLTCRRKHYYQYEMGITRADATTSDALYFGSLFHEALAAWWKHFVPQAGDTTNGNSNRKTPAGCASVA